MVSASHQDITMLLLVLLGQNFDHLGITGLKEFTERRKHMKKLLTLLLLVALIFSCKKEVTPISTPYYDDHVNAGSYIDTATKDVIYFQNGDTNTVHLILSGLEFQATRFPGKPNYRLYRTNKWYAVHFRAIQSTVPNYGNGYIMNGDTLDGKVFLGL